jgi:citrate synthase
MEARKKYHQLYPTVNRENKNTFAQAVSSTQQDPGILQTLKLLLAGQEETKKRLEAEQSPKPSNDEGLKEMMALLLAGQEENKAKLEEQTKKIEQQSKKLEEQSKILAEQSNKISEQAKEIASLRKENEKLKRNTESEEDKKEKSSAKKLKRVKLAGQTNKEMGQQVAPTSEDEMDVDVASTTKPGRKQHSRVDFLKES